MLRAWGSLARRCARGVWTDGVWCEGAWSPARQVRAVATSRGGNGAAEAHARACLELIHSENEETNAFITVLEEQALQQARESDARYDAGDEVGAVDGMVVSLKDNFALSGVRNTAASHMLDNYVAPYDSTVAERLREDGAVMVGKTNMDEFAMGSSTSHTPHGTVRNRRAHMYGDKQLSAGGSSGGAAVAVAEGMCDVAFGTDTSGSVRQPAALCGVIGYKPAYGRISRWGVIAHASSLDCVGVLGTSMTDVAAAMECVAGVDGRDSSALHAPVPAYMAAVRGASSTSLAGVRVGIPDEYAVKEMSDGVRAAWEHATATAERLGASLVRVSMPHMKYALSAYYIIAPAEAASNLARYDGVRYGFRAVIDADADADADDVLGGGVGFHEMVTATRSQGFGAEVRRRVLLGNYVLSHEAYDVYFTQAQRMRRCIRDDFDAAFARVDVLLAPTVPNQAIFHEDVRDAVDEYALDALVGPSSLAGMPSMSVPMPGGADGLPASIQLMSAVDAEETLFSTATTLTAAFTSQ